LFVSGRICLKDKKEEKRGLGEKEEREDSLFTLLTFTTPPLKKTPFF